MATLEEKLELLNSDYRNYVSLYSSFVILDGHFTLSDVKLILEIMEEQERKNNVK